MDPEDNVGVPGPYTLWITNYRGIQQARPDWLTRLYGIESLVVYSGTLFMTAFFDYSVYRCPVNDLEAFTLDTSFKEQANFRFKCGGNGIIFCTKEDAGLGAINAAPLCRLPIFPKF